VIKTLGVSTDSGSKSVEDPQGTVLTGIVAGNSIYDYCRRRVRHSTAGLERQRLTESSR
jgi:hypothetical protein